MNTASLEATTNPTHYDSTRRACYFGYITQAIVNNLAPLLFIVFQTRYGVPYEMLGRLVLLNFFTQLITDVVALKVVDRIGFRAPLVLAHALCSLGLVLLAILPSVFRSPYIGLCIAVVVYAIGGGLLEVVSPVVDAIPIAPEHKAAAMSLLHSFYCWGQVAVVLGTTLLLWAVGDFRWQWLPVVWAVVPFINLFVFLKVPMPPTLPDEHRMPLRRLLAHPAFLAALVLMLCAGASELTMSQWSSLFAERGLGLPKIWGDIAGPCLFAVLMGIGRVVFSLLGDRVALSSALIGCGVLATACYLVVSLSRNPVISLIACAICGFAVSLLWPGAFSMTAARFPAGGTAMFGMLAVFGDAGAGGGPWLAGAVADASAMGLGIWRHVSAYLQIATEDSLRIGLLCGVVFPVGVVLSTLAYRCVARQTSEP